MEWLAIKGRPLSGDIASLRRMAREREPYYEACADCTVENAGALGKSVQIIKEAYDEALCH